MPNDKPLYTLYKSILADNKFNDIPRDYATFERALTAPGKQGTQNRLQLHKALVDNGYTDVPKDYASFANTLFVPKKSNNQVVNDGDARSQRGGASGRDGTHEQRNANRTQQSNSATKEDTERAFNNALGFGNVTNAERINEDAHGGNPLRDVQGHSNYVEVQQSKPKHKVMTTRTLVNGVPRDVYTTDFGNKTLDAAEADKEQELSAMINNHIADEWRKAGKQSKEAPRGAKEVSWAEPAISRAMQSTIDNVAAHMTAYDLQQMADRAWDKSKGALTNYYYKQLDPSATKADNADLLKKAEALARQKVDESVYAYAVKQNAPKGVLDYLSKSIADNNMMTSVVRGAARIKAGTTGDLDAYEQAMSKYAEMHKAAGVGGTVLGMAADPTTYIGGFVGGQAGKLALRVVGKQMLKGGAVKAAEGVAERLASRTLAGRISAGLGGGIGNMGYYEVAKNIEDQYAHGGAYDEETGKRAWSGTSVLKSALRGGLLGASTGVIGPMIGNVSDKVVKATNNAWGKIGAKTGGYVTSVLAEGTVFATPEWLHNAYEDDYSGKKKSYADIWYGSMGTIVGFKAHGAAKKIMAAPEYIRSLRPIKEPITPSDYKRNRLSFGELWRKQINQSSNDLDFTKEEINELKSLGYDKLADLFKRTKSEGAKKTASGKTMPKVTDSKDVRVMTMNPIRDNSKVGELDFDGYDAMEALISDKSVSQGTRAKAYYLLTGRQLPMSTVIGYTIDEDKSDKHVTVKATSMGGEVVTSKTFKNKEAARGYIDDIKRQSELNYIEAGEQRKEVKAGEDAINKAIDEALPGWDADVAKNMYNLYADDPKKYDWFKDEYEKINEALVKGKDELKAQMPEAIRDMIRKTTGVDVDKALKKSADKRGVEEQEAINEYIKRLYDGEKEQTEKGDDVDGYSTPMDVDDKPFGEDTPIGDSSEERDPRMNIHTGALVGATLKNGDKRVYVVSGELATREDGTVDVANSDDTIVVYDEATGEKMMMSPKDFASTDGGVPREIGYQDEVTYVDNDGDVRHGVVNRVDDEVVEVVTDDGRVERYGRGEFDWMLREGDAIREGEESGDAVREGGVAEGGVSSDEVMTKEGGVPHDATEEVKPTEKEKPTEVASADGVTAEKEKPADGVVAPTEVAPTDGVATDEGVSSERGSALGRIPKDEGGEPKYEEVDAETAWDAILEQTEGDEGMAQSVVDSMVEDKRKALKEAEKSKAKQGGTISEKIKAEKERQAVIDKAKGDLEKWEEIAAERERRANVAKGETEPKEETEPKMEGEPKTEAKGETAKEKSDGKVDETTEEVEAKEGERQIDDEMRKKERRENIVSNMGDKYSLSDEQTNNGECFVQNEDGLTNLATIPDEIFNSLGIEPIPFKLTETMAWHVFEHHKKEAKMNSISDAIDFVLSVVNNVDHVRKGRDNSYIFSIENNRNKLGRRAITIVVNSETGDFMGIRTSGYETIKKLEKRPLLWERSTLAAPEDVATSTISTDKPQQGDEATSRTKSQSNVSSDGKGTMKDGEVQGNGGESDGGKGGNLSEKIDAASAEVNTEPTEAQKEAGNYKKGHVEVREFDITIEQPKGSIRRGTDANGKKWENKMHNAYGYIRGTEGVDGDHIDVFLSNDMDRWNEVHVYVVDQYNPDGTFDEHKVMFGFNDMDEAKSDYLANYEKGWENGRRIDVSEVILIDFVEWIESSHRKTKPFTEYKIAQEAKLKEFQRKYNEGLKEYEEHKAEQAEGLKGLVDDLKREGIDVGEHLADQTKRNINDDGFFVNGEGGTTVYHGTQKLDLEVEDLGAGHHRVDGEKAGFNGEGVYFTPTDDNDYGNGRGEKMLSCKLKISKPFYLVGNLALEDALRSKKFSDVLLSHGYDAIIVYSSKDSMILNQDPMEMIALRREVIVPIEKRVEKGEDGKANLIVGKDAVFKHLQKAVWGLKKAWLSGEGKEAAIEALKKAVGEVDKKEAAMCYLFSFYPKERVEGKEYIGETLRVMREALGENGVEMVDGGKVVRVGDIVRCGGKDGQADDVALGEVVFADRGSLTLDNGKRVSRRSVLGYGRLKEEEKSGKGEVKPMEDGKEKPMRGEAAKDVSSKEGKGDEGKSTAEGKGEKTDTAKVGAKGDGEKGGEVNGEGNGVDVAKEEDKVEGKGKEEKPKDGKGENGGKSKGDGGKEEKTSKAEGKGEAKESKGGKGKGEVAADGKEKEKIDDVGEKIAGARKDWLSDVSKKLDNVTEESLVALPFAKAFKRPNLKEAVEKGALRVRDAHFAEAVMAAFCSRPKPRLLKGWKARSSEMEVKRWARDVCNGVELMKMLMNADEATRDKIIEAALSKKVYSEEEVEQRKRDLEEWNNGRKFTGECYPINPLKFFMDVYEGLGYGNVGEVKLPISGVVPATGYGSYDLMGVNGKKIYLRSDMTSYEDVVREAVYLTKLFYGDADTDHPTSKFRVRGVDPVFETKGWMANGAYMKGRRQIVVTEHFKTREEAEKWCEEFKKEHEDGYVGRLMEEKERTGWGGYEVSLRNDWTDGYVDTGLKYGTMEEAREAIDAEHERLNEIVNGKIREEMEKEGEKSGRGKRDYVNVVYYTETGVEGYRYGVVLDEKYAPRKKSAWNTMPYMLAKGFKTREEAEGYIKEHREELDKMVEDVKKRRREFVYFGGNGEVRVGEDYRRGEDVSAEQLREQFGFRGVQFGNWTNQRDRQAAVNNAFDALMDLARVLCVSPKALSLNGELGLAFGARGSGGAAAHYEPQEVVINLTKTNGAGALAHEWWHALDNYFARRGNVKLGMVTNSKGIRMREELREAFNALIDGVEKSDFHKRSNERGESYWGTRHEETARLFEMWVGDELRKRGEANVFLTSSDAKAEERYAKMNYRIYKNFAEMGDEEVMSYEDFRKTPTALNGFVYPTRGELETMGLRVRKIFDIIQERTEEATGNVVMYHRGKVVVGGKGKGEMALMNAVIGLQRGMGLRVVTDVDGGQGVLDLLRDGKGMSYHRVYHGSGVDFDKVRFFKTRDGEVYGFTDGKSIYIDPRVATAETPIHEYAHLWATALRKGNVKEWGNVVGLMKGTKVWDEVREMYPELKGETEVAEEVIAMYSGRRGAERLREEMRGVMGGDGSLTERAAAVGAIGRVKRALEKFWRGVADFLGVHYTTAEEVADRVMRDMLSGVDPRWVGVDERVREQIVGERGAKRMDEGEDGRMREEGLMVAREMEREGRDERAIKLATGWERGRDGKWRYEVEALRAKGGDVVKRYREVVDGKRGAVERAEKRLAEVEAEIGALSERVGELGWKEGGLSKEEEREMREGNDRLEGLYEEAMGLRDEVEWGKMATLGELCEESEVFEAYPELRDVKVEIGDANGYIGYYSNGRNKIVLSKDRLELADACLVHEVQHAIQRMEGFEGGGDMKMGERIARERSGLTEMQQKFVDDVRMYDEMMTDERGREEYPLSAFIRDNIRDGVYDRDFARDFGVMSDEELRAEAERLMGMEGERLDGFEAYRRIAGEVEARNAAARMGMEMGEKRRSLLEDTEDVERGKQILLSGENGGENAMSVGEGYDYEKYPLGRVERGLSEKEVDIVRGEEEHGFKNYGEAKRWAKEHIARTYDNEETGGKGRVRISNTAIDKFLSESAVGKSENKDVHMGVLKVLPDVLKTSIDAETHPDFLKGEDGERGPKNGMNKDVLVHRLYGAVDLGGKMYRVKITLKENVKSNEANKAYSYEATKIELLEGTVSKTEGSRDLEPSNSKPELSAGQHGKASGLTSAFPRYSDSSIAAAKLLKGVEKSYEKGKYLLDESDKGDAELRFRGRDAATSKRVEEGMKRMHVDWGKGVRDLAEGLGVGDRVEVVESADEVEGVTQGMRGAKGWYDPKTGKVVVVLDRHRTVEDVMRTVLHEVVGHYGLRRMVGREGMNALMDGVFARLDEETRKRVAREAKGHGWDVRVATEEYLASLAEDGGFEEARRRGVWERVKGLVGDVLMGLGWKRGTLDDGELRYLLWRSYVGLRRGEGRGMLDRAEDVALQWRLGVGMFRRERPLTVGEMRNVEESVLYREDRERVMARDDYDRMVSEAKHRMNLAWADSMSGLKLLQESIERNGGGKLREWEDAYMAENRMSSKSMAEMEGYRGSFYRDLIDAVDGLTSGGRTTYEGVVEYMMARHGLERNVVFARRDARRMAEAEVGKRVRELRKVVNDKGSSDAAVKRAEDGIREAEALLVGVRNGLGGVEAQQWYDRRRGKLDKALGDGKITREKYDGKVRELDTLYNEGLGEVYFPRFRDRDYSGLTALTGEEDVTDAEAAAWKMVGAFEGENDTMELWRATNAATNASLDKEYECGLLTRGERDYLKGMFDYYIPLQGFEEKTSDEVYGYVDNRNGRMGGVIRRAKGRRSLADDPIATIGNNAARSIMMGNRNDMKMHFLRMVLNHPSDAVSVNKLYLRYDGVKDEWVPQFADIRKDASSDEVKSEVEAFNKKMEGLCKTHPDEYKEAGEKENVPYRVVGANIGEHQVHVKMLGKDYVLTINGNPEAAQALNGLLNPGTMEGATKWFEQMNHWLAAMYTQKNPAFIFTNLSRDAIFANSMALVKENKAYRRRFHKNFLKTGWKLIGLMRRYKNGTLDMSEKDDKYYHEFVMNGGQTGYAFQRSVKEYKKMISKELERRHRSKLNPKSWFSILDKGITAVNEWSENVSRFNTYKTSREMGRSIERSIWDAKEITVNFNKRGAGKAVAGKWEEGNRWNYLQAWLSQWCKNGYVFFNAGVQGLSNVMRNVKAHKGKAIGMAATYFAAGMAMPAIMSALNTMMGGNDDDYYDVPSWVRRNNICIWTGNGYVTIPLPIELRAFYGLGELAYSTMVGKEEGSVAKETVSQLTQVLPIDFMEGGGSWQAFIPSYVKPLVEAYGTNKDWTGRPISKQTPFNENAPEWTKTYKGTNGVLTWLAEMSNELSGGTEVEPGDVNWNPAKVQHMMEGYFGGVAKMLTKMYSTVAMPFDESQREWRNVPIISSFYQGTDDRTKDRAVKTKFFEYYDEYKKTKDALDKYEKKIDDDDITLRERAKYQVLLNSDKGVRREVMEDFASDIKELRDEMQTLDDKSEAYKKDERELISIYRQVNRAMKMVDDKFAKKVSALWSEMDKINAKYEKGDDEEMSEAEEAQREKELEGPRRKLNKLFDEAEKD